MYRRRFLAVAGLAAVAGCTGSGPASEAATPTQESTDDECDCPETPAGETAADIRLTSIGQSPTNDGSVIEVQGAVVNDGETSHDTTAVIQLLDGEDAVAERSVEIGTLTPGETATFMTTFDVSPSAVDGRRITFD